jgi:hypothetical protein
MTSNVAAMRAATSVLNAEDRNAVYTPHGPLSLQIVEKLRRGSQRGTQHLLRRRVCTPSEVVRKTHLLLKTAPLRNRHRTYMSLNKHFRHVAKNARGRDNDYFPKIGARLLEGFL